MRHAQRTAGVSESTQRDDRVTATGPEHHPFHSNHRRHHRHVRTRSDSDGPVAITHISPPALPFANDAGPSPASDVRYARLNAGLGETMRVATTGRSLPLPVLTGLSVRGAVRGGSDSAAVSLTLPVLTSRPYRTVMAAFEMTGVPRSFVFASMRIVFPSFHIEVTMVSPGNTTPAKRAW